MIKSAINSLKIFDTQFAHAKSAGSPYQDTITPFEWERDFIEIHPDETVFFTESAILDVNIFSNIKKILWVVESPSMVGYDIIQLVKKRHQDFEIILTHDDDLLALTNAIAFPVGGCWIKPQDAEIYEKIQYSVSNIASDKRFLYGQMMRHAMGERKDVKMFGPSYTPLNYKLEALKDFQFNVCIENMQNNTYFTEKIIDCFATGTIPIYWGSKNISNFFNTNGIIEVDDLEEINYVIDNIKEFKVDQSAIEENFELSKKYWLPETRILDIVRGRI